MIRKCTINISTEEMDYSFVGDVYYNDDHEVIETNNGAFEYEMKVLTDYEEVFVSIECTVEIETFDGERLGRKKMVGVTFIDNETIIYLK